MAGPTSESQQTGFKRFWDRLQEQFRNAPVKNGHHVLEVQNWTQDHGDLPDVIPIFWDPGRDSGAWRTGDKNIRPFSVGEMRKIYDVWEDYRAGRTKRTFITNTLGVQNSKPIIALFKRFEHLMA
jgi:hypothetical protein